MPIKHGIGYGEHTPEKLQCFERLLSMHIRWTKAVLQRNPYWTFRYHYIDATAGCGYCPESDMLGSPLVFLEVAHRLEMPYRADFIEIEPGNHFLLMGTIPDNASQHTTTHHGDYRDVIPRLLKTGSQKDFGLLFVDHSGDAKPPFDVETLSLVSRSRPKMEILIYVSAANVKRVLHETETRLESYLATIEKRYWLVREPMGRHQWTFLCGSNSDQLKDYRAIGFHRLDSIEGQQVFNTLNYTNQELEAWQQPSLPFIEPMPNISGTQPIGASEQMPLSGLEVYASDARKDQ